LAIQLLDISPKDRIADVFCGLGNFSLAAAKKGAYVIGFEGSAVLVKRAKENARENHLDRSEFYSKDLTMPDSELLAFLSTVNKVIIDPPRTGAIEIIKALPDTIKTMVYISCNPATFARDASFLVNSQGFTLRKTGIVNLFPHTNHVESIALLTR
jgi:23S rRNA (uracil1939-C5)-methyltransferase